MFYALAGIPLNLVMFQSIGERLNIFVTFLLHNFKKCFKFKNREVSQTNLIMICGIMSNVVVAGGAWAFSYYEGWNYLDAFYYCVITLTTIGLNAAIFFVQSCWARPSELENKMIAIVTYRNSFILIFVLF